MISGKLQLTTHPEQVIDLAAIVISRQKFTTIYK